MVRPRRKLYYQHTRQWFRNRVGKRIYRKKRSCKCLSCQKTYVDILDGVRDGKQVVRRDFHADYLFMVHNEIGIKYYDKPVLQGDKR